MHLTGVGGGGVGLDGISPFSRRKFKLQTLTRGPIK